MLDGARDAERDVQLGATVWPELPTCRSIGSQPLSQIGRDAAISAPIAAASFSATAIWSCALMPAPHGDDALGLAEIHGLARFLERRLDGLARRRIDGTLRP
jgi:hypothetical protein